MAASGIRAHQIRVLAGVADHLASAVEAVSLGECQWVASEIVEILGAVEDLRHLLETGREVPPRVWAYGSLRVFAGPREWRHSQEWCPRSRLR